MVKYFSELQRLKVVGIPWLVCAAICDLLITISLSGHLVSLSWVYLVIEITSLVCMYARVAKKADWVCS